MLRPMVLLVALLVLLAACSSNREPTPAPVAAVPTDTPLPTATPSPTNTPEPTATPTPAPTDTPTAEPTATPTATATLTPTNTPTPTATPTPVAVVIGDRLNVRSGPGTVYPAVGQAKKGETLPVLSRTQDGAWLEVALAGERRGWVSAALVALNLSAETLPIARVIPPTPTPALPSSVTAGALLHVRMVADGDPQEVGRSQFPAGISKVWCAYEVNTSLGQPGQSYSLRVINSAGEVVAQSDLVSFTAGLRPGLRIAVASPVQALSGTYRNGAYRTEILLNGQVIATLNWSVGP